MNGGKYLKIFLGIAAFVLLVKISVTVLVSPWIGKKVEDALNKNNSDLKFEIGKVKVSLIKSRLILEEIKIGSKLLKEGDRKLAGEIGSVTFTGIKLGKLIFKNEIDIKEITIPDCTFTGEIPPPQESPKPLVAPSSIRIGSILLGKINLALKNATTPQTYSVKNGRLKLDELHAEKQDTIGVNSIGNFDFEAEEIGSVMADSMNTLTGSGIQYSGTSKTLVADSLSLHPNYGNYQYTSRYKFQKPRMEAGFGHISVHGASGLEFMRSASLISTYVEIEKMDIQVFLDQRKEFHHVKKTTFQDLIYGYPGYIRIDSINLAKGDVRYTAHALKANEPGMISFHDIRAKIFNITNDSAYKTKKECMELHGETLLMGSGKLTVLLKAPVLDIHNTFSLIGSLSGMDADKLNPILEKNAFIYATSGKIDAMNFNFTANNQKATGTMTLLYHGLDLTVKNKRTDDTTALVERFISFIVNRRIYDSNPMPGERKRIGMIDYDRDPERFLFDYCFKSILSGMKSSLAKKPEKNNVFK